MLKIGRSRFLFSDVELEAGKPYNEHLPGGGAGEEGYP